MAQYYTSTRFRPECPTCGNKLGQLEESYKRLLEQGKTPHDALDSLGIQRPCCRVRALWPVVIPIGGFYIPHHEASMLNYLGLKEAAPQPNLVVLSLVRAATGEEYIVSHVDKDGFIGQIATAKYREPTEVVIHGEGEQRVLASNPDRLPGECTVRIQTEPGEITRGFPYETRAFRRGIAVDRVQSYFDLAPTDIPLAEETVNGGDPMSVDQLIAASADDAQADAPLFTADSEDDN